MTVISRPRNNYGFLFGNGADGDVTISANTNLPSTLNGDIIYRNYMNLTINSGCTLSVSNMCKGLWIRVRGVLTLNGAISMSNKGCYIAGGGSDLYLCYSDIKVPAVGAAGGVNGNGSNGVDGQCGGGGGEIGGDGFVGGGGCGGSGRAWVDIGGTVSANGEAGQAYGLRGGNGVYVEKNGIGMWSGGGAGGVTGGTSGGGAAAAGQAGSGGILVVMANQVVGSGSLLSRGANGGNGMKWDDGSSHARGGAGGGSGGGSITLFFFSMNGTPTFDASGGAGGSNPDAPAGAAGGAGSCRDYSLAELLSHTRV